MFNRIACKERNGEIARIVEFIYGFSFLLENVVCKSFYERQMITDLEKHLTSAKPDIDWRFDDQVENLKETLKKISVVDNEAENLIWDSIKGGDFLQDYSLNKNKFDTFEEIEFSGDYSLITKRLKEMKNTGDKVILTWFSGDQTLLTDLKTFIDNWHNFVSPSADDLLVIDEKWNWIIYISHFELFQFGQGIEFK